MNYDKVIRLLRKQSGLSINDLAYKSGLSRSAIYHLESGKRKPSLDTARKICIALDKSLKEFD